MFLVGVIGIAGSLGYIPSETVSSLGLVWPSLLVLFGFLLMLRIRRGSVVISLVAVVVLFVIFVFGLTFQPSPVITPISQPFQKNMDKMQVKLTFHGGVLKVHDSVEMFRSSMKSTVPAKPFASVEVSGSNYNLTLGEAAEKPNLFGGWSGNHNWDIGVNGFYPSYWEVDSHGVAGELDLARVHVSSIDVLTSFSTMSIRFGESTPKVDAHIQAAFSRIYIHVPENAGLFVRSSLFGSSNLRQTGFTEVTSDQFMSDNYETAPVKIDLEVDAGASAMQVQYY